MAAVQVMIPFDEVSEFVRVVDAAPAGILAKRGSRASAARIKVRNGQAVLRIEGPEVLLEKRFSCEGEWEGSIPYGWLRERRQRGFDGILGLSVDGAHSDTDTVGVSSWDAFADLREEFDRRWGFQASVDIGSLLWAAMAASPESLSAVSGNGGCITFQQVQEGFSGLLVAGEGFAFRYPHFRMSGLRQDLRVSVLARQIGAMAPLRGSYVTIVFLEDGLLAKCGFSDSRFHFVKIPAFLGPCEEGILLDPGGSPDSRFRLPTVRYAERLASSLESIPYDEAGPEIRFRGGTSADVVGKLRGEDTSTVVSFPLGPVWDWEDVANPVESIPLHPSFTRALRMGFTDFRIFRVGDPGLAGEWLTLGEHRNGSLFGFLSGIVADRGKACARIGLGDRVCRRREWG
jgi:hypothetical protein